MIGDIFFELSVRSVRLNFLRSILASIGIVIGVVAISTMGMLGTNMQLQVKDQLASSANTIVITADAIRMGPPGIEYLISHTSIGNHQDPAEQDQIGCGDERFGDTDLFIQYAVHVGKCPGTGNDLRDGPG